MRRLSRHLFEIWSGDNAGAPLVLHFPYAGGGIHALRDFAFMLPRRRHLVVNYPGRGARAADPASDSIEEIAADVAAEYTAAAAECVGFPVSPLFIGHSMGAYVALETAVRLASCGMRCAGIVVSSSPPPSISTGASPPQTLGGRIVADMDDDELTKVLIDEGGLPDEVRYEKDLLEILLPVVQHDFMLGALYAKRGHAEPVPFPIVAVGGAEDASVSPESLHGWRRCTSASFATRVWPGGHFWFRSRPDDFADFALGALHASPIDPADGQGQR